MIQVRWPCYLWLSFLAAALIATTAGLLHSRCWRRRETWIACADLLVLCIAAFLARRWLTSTIILDWPVRLPEPGHCGFQRNGPGYEVLANLCFWARGASDGSVIFGNILIGAFTVVPVYVLVRLASGGRGAAAAAGAILTLMAPHVRMSNVDDPAPLVGLLVASALAVAEGAAVTRRGSFTAAACLSAALAALTRPELTPALIVMFAMLAADSALRQTLRRPAVLGVAVAVCLAVVGVFVTQVHNRLAEGQTLVFTPQAEIMVIFWAITRFLLVMPPRAPALFAFLIVVGMVIAPRTAGARPLFWLLVGLAPVAASAPVVGYPVGEKHQAALLPISAALAGIGAAWLSTRVASALPAMRWRATLVGALLIGQLLGWWLWHVPPLPTFALEYQFFEKNLAVVPDHCTLLFPDTDPGNGMYTPKYLSALRGYDHRWVRVTDNVDPRGTCLMYWKPAACHTGLVPESWFPSLELLRDAGLETGIDFLLPPRDCLAVEQAYCLEPVVETVLPYRPGFGERLRSDGVPVGFYRLYPRPAPNG